MPNEDWLPPLKPPSDDLKDVHTAWGVMPKWKARALAIGEIQRMISDATDDGGMPERTPLRDEDKPPDVAADQRRSALLDNIVRRDIAARERRIADLQQMGARCDALLDRYANLEKTIAAKRAAHAELMRVEDLCTSPEEPGADDIMH
jgi:hypothetical protein